MFLIVDLAKEIEACPENNRNVRLIFHMIYENGGTIDVMHILRSCSKHKRIRSFKKWARLLSRVFKRSGFDEYSRYKYWGYNRCNLWSNL